MKIDRLIEEYMGEELTPAQKAAKARADATNKKVGQLRQQHANLEKQHAAENDREKKRKIQDKMHQTHKEISDHGHTLDSDTEKSKNRPKHLSKVHTWRKAK